MSQPTSTTPRRVMSAYRMRRAALEIVAEASRVAGRPRSHIVEVGAVAEAQRAIEDHRISEEIRAGRIQVAPAPTAPPPAGEPRPSPQRYVELEPGAEHGDRQ